MRRSAPWLLLTLVACNGDDPFAAGVQAYRAERFRDALESFTIAEQAAGYGATAELLCNRALAALRCGALRVAEYSAEKAVARGGMSLAAFRDFVLGSAAHARCQRARAEMELADPDPTAFDRAIAQAENARDGWQRAAMHEPDWPAARRNVERILPELEELKRLRDEAERNRRARQENQPQPDPDAEPPAAPDQQDPGIEVQPTAQADPDALTPDQLDQLLGLLDAVEREKRAVRQARRQSRSTAVERDW